ncbi:glycerol kinase GlpK [Coraliomargarita akajimensis]|uniref:Glycerol kinase n=1 Tax=Coraliomargarita akajimensis (strain DSM 45221 / IAM 15411 / JCM 23193 / KCTC 12865 / 04OKA010-24) TaxID=583355 RepID=D5EM80_CORAD|nr:glycerol kinase GlpK [Coraliomargarita akajimensis]ADE55240.1 glycerol kinase [Coraliomargarita akajimensis DSM 45221]
MPRNYLLALDQGTTSSRAILFDNEGSLVGKAQSEFTQHFPENGWVEHDANEIWSSQSGVIAEVLAKTGVDAEDLAGIGITNQRETTVLWNRKTGMPLHNAIVWQDRRTAKLCEQLKADGLEECFRKKTGLRLDPYFSGTKLKWLLDNIDGAREQADRGELAFGTIDTWLLWKLSKGRIHKTDTSNASRTLLFNIHDCQWDPELLAILNIPDTLLPEVCPSSHFYGEAVRGGLEGIPMTGVAGDQQAALFGQTCFRSGQAKNTYGTGCFLLRPSEQQAIHSTHNLLTTLACTATGKAQYALEGSVFIGGAVIQWLRDQLGIIRQASETEALARSVQDTAGVYLIPAFSGLGAPHWNPDARGMLCGLTRGSSKAHIVRAALESIAYQSLDLLEAMNADCRQALAELRVDGGAAQNDFLMQFQADLMQVPVVRPQITETTALGAAYLAGLGCGVWSSQDELATQWRSERQFDPQLSADRAAEKIDGWQRALKASKHWAIA